MTGHFADAAAHHHGHVLADVGAGVVVEPVAGFVGEREVAPAAGRCSIGAGLGGAEVAAGHNRGALDDKEPVGVGAGAMLPEPCSISSSGGRAPLTLASAACSSGKRTAPTTGVNLKPGRGLDDALHLVQVADARQLHQDLVGAQAVRLDQRLADAQVTRSRMVSMACVNRPLFQSVLDQRLHGQRPGVVGAAAGEVVLVGVFLVEQRAHGAGLCRRESLDLDELGLVRDRA